ncbi:hypothetical protein [Albirhodobacter sp. R86504]|uniref:hypothetical protein n=1 Tax=Albirhodobacter sp. R86504 TaxID=3093848 RepID=UPI00366D146C
MTAARHILCLYAAACALTGFGALPSRAQAASVAPSCVAIIASFDGEGYVRNVDVTCPTSAHKHVVFVPDAAMGFEQVAVSRETQGEGSCARPLDDTTSPEPRHDQARILLMAAGKGEAADRQPCAMHLSD